MVVSLIQQSLSEHPLPADMGILDLPQAPGTKPAWGPGALPSMTENECPQASRGLISMSLPDAKRNFSPAFLLADGLDKTASQQVQLVALAFCG